jgi:hypothetical protein
MRVVLVLCVGAIAWGCGAASHEADPPAPGPCPGDPHHCCDPDDCECECTGYWRCTETFETRHCVQQNPGLPSSDPYAWECGYTPGFIVCVADIRQLDREADDWWDCTPSGDVVECRRPVESSDFPEEDGRWQCAYELGGGAPARTCDEIVDGAWQCELDEQGLSLCRNDHPDQPDGGDWDCYRVDGADVCISDHFPDSDGSDWDCFEDGELVECERNPGEVPPGGGAWDCAWGSDFLECQEVDPDPPDPDPVPCACVEGGLRVCDEATMSNWGEQECESRAESTRWGRCDEIATPSGCEPGGALAREFEWHYRGGYWDGQVFDPDDDGVILMPADNWFNPAAQDCAMRLGLCVQDMWDLDLDQDNQESVGGCDGIDECA